MNNIKYDESEDNTVIDRPGAEDHADQTSFNKAIREQIASSKKVKPEQLKMLSESTWVNTEYDESEDETAVVQPNTEDEANPLSFDKEIRRKVVSSSTRTNTQWTATPVRVAGLFHPCITKPDGERTWWTTVWSEKVDGASKWNAVKIDGEEERVKIVQIPCRLRPVAITATWLPSG